MGDDVVEEKPETEEAVPKQENAANGVAQEKTEDKSEENKAEKPAVEQQPPLEKDEEEITRTYDEFLKVQAGKNARLEAIALPKQRRPGEGVDQAAWKGFVPLQREPKEEDEEEEDEEDGKPKEKKAKDVKKVPFTEILSIRQDSPKRDSDRGGRGRGGRGRGGRGRDRDRDGADRGARRASSKPMTIVNDDQNFPALT